MRFLDLVNRCRRECVSGGPDVTTLQSGLVADTRRFVDWIATAWTDLQLRRPDWNWMRKTTTFQTVVGQRTYSLAQTNAPDVSAWMPWSFRASMTSLAYADEMPMSPWDYDNFQDLYLLGSTRTVSNRPMGFTVNPVDQSLILDSLPNAVYTIQADYYRTPTDLVNDDDDPASVGNDLPERFHMVLVYDAMRMYASHFAAPEIDDRALRKQNMLNRRLELWGLPSMGSAGAIA